jgi:hypothetical protein
MFFYRYKEDKLVNIQLLNEYIEELKDTLQDGLIATSIFNQEDGVPIAEYNIKANSNLAYNSITNYILKKFRDNNLSNIDKFMIFSLENDVTLVIIPVYNYRWAILVDNNKIKLGVLLNMTIPKTRKKLKEIL